MPLIPTKPARRSRRITGLDCPRRDRDGETAFGSAERAGGQRRHSQKAAEKTKVASPFGPAFNDIMQDRLREADEFYAR